MKTFPPGLTVLLQSGVTTLCTCWKLTRRDGAVLGFTDHNRQLSFDGVDFEAESGLKASEWAHNLGLAIDTVEADGALTSEALTEEDLEKGLWDDAAVEIYLVDWSDTENRALMGKASIGEVSRGRFAFRAELRGLAHVLNQEVGRIYGHPCDAVLGDGRCQVDLDDPSFKGTGTVTAVSDNRLLTASGLDAFDDGWFAGGVLSWETGANQGLRTEVLVHTKADGTVNLALVEKAPQDIVAADTFTVTAGCDKSFPTCKAKFDNVVNHRGFPHMPGNDSVFTYAVPGEGDHDGGSFFN
ncbi:DUF2163 domain-containing protein [Chelativorans alearense]|uniref:DUF2163 domain-containing protein n=1 Tax=Chelativorans alearense TaxID=2681495 RepID=UPI0013D27FEF|nr:DUF2163 domain-containing protein [Chelativorans alearense]